MTQKKVMIVDDNQGNSDLYKDQFEYSGYAVKQVWAGEAVADALKTFKPDAITLDLMLPGITGQEVLTWLKGNEETKAIPVVILTAKGTSVEEEQELRKLADDFIFKLDLMPHEVVERVAKLIGQ